MTPEDKARQTITNALTELGYAVHDRLLSVSDLFPQDFAREAVERQFQTSGVEFHDIGNAVDEAISTTVRYAAKTVVAGSREHSGV